MRGETHRAIGAAQLVGAAALVAAVAAPALGAVARERALEQIPELMGRILESQEQIREQESELEPVVKRYEEKLTEARRQIEDAGSEEQAAEALVDYVEAYAARLDTQQKGLRAIEGPVVRMRADARELRRAAEVAGDDPETPEQRQHFFEDQFQGVAAGTSALAERLGRGEDAATAGAVLQAGWASHGALNLPLARLGPDGAAAFARKVEGLYARHQARTQQLRAERRAVRRLLDVLIERQLARRLDGMFAGSDEVGLGAILSGEGKGEDWQELGSVVGRALGLPAGSDAGVDLARRPPSAERLEYFARGEHRE